MKPRLRTAFTRELQQARDAQARQDPASAWLHLERAHILSQAYALEHVIVHALMLAHGWRRRDAREVWGQLVRLVLAAPGSWLGRGPLGNTGGVNVGLLTPMPISEELRRLLER